MAFLIYVSYENGLSNISNDVTMNSSQAILKLNFFFYPMQYHFYVN